MVIGMEPCQSGLTYLFAKEAGASKPLEGSNPSVSADLSTAKSCGDEQCLGALREGFEARLSIFCEQSETKNPIGVLVL